MAHRREPGKEEGLRGREDLHDREELHDRENLRGNEEDELRVQRTEEELAAGTREREAGEVRVNKRVRTDREQVRIPPQGMRRSASSGCP
jgi:stress response protein YsnF